MARNSIREQILVYHKKQLIDKIKSINNSIRIMPAYADLQQFAVTQFPLVAIVGRLPIPVEKVSSRDGSNVDIVISELRIDNFCYLQEGEDQDTKLSEVLDDIWAKCYSDVTYGGLALSTVLKPEEETVYWEPFIAFRVISVVKYKHSMGGI